MKKRKLKNNFSIFLIITILAIILIAFSLIYIVNKNQFSEDKGFLSGILSAVKGAVKVTQCSDHLDNDKNGFCDYSYSGAYCSDGSKLGDSGCSSQSDTSELTVVCIPTAEICDGKDNNCDGLIDNGGNCAVNYYCDKDTDGYYSSTVSGGCIASKGCRIPTGCVNAIMYESYCNDYKTIKCGDCNDLKLNIHPGFIEEDCVGDDIDNNCNGVIDDCFNKTCKELFPGTNDKYGDRINIIFVRFLYPSQELFLNHTRASIDYYQNINSTTNNPNISPPIETKGLLELSSYKDNKQKFNFWYVNVTLPNKPELLYKGIGYPDVDIYESCGNILAKEYCPGLSNYYYSYFCYLDFTSKSQFGGKSWISVNSATYKDLIPWVFSHEFQHQFPQLADEYTGGSSQPRQPNCAGGLSIAQIWWGNLTNQTGADNLTIGYYPGCSYVSTNYRPTLTSIMRTLDSRLGLVSEKWIANLLTSFKGSSGTGMANIAQITLEGNPDDLSSYTITEISSIELTNEEKIKMNEPYTIKLKAGNKEFIQNFDVYDYIVTEDFSKTGITGDLTKLSKTKIKILVPIGKSKINKQTKTIDLPEQADAQLSIEISKKDSIINTFDYTKIKDKIV